MTITYKGNIDLGRVDENIILSKYKFDDESEEYPISGVWNEEENELTLSISKPDPLPENSEEEPREEEFTAQKISIYTKDNTLIFEISDSEINLAKKNNIFRITFPTDNVRCSFSFETETGDTRFLEDFGTFLGDNVYVGDDSEPALLDTAYRFYRISSVLEPSGEISFPYLKNGTGEKISSHYILRTYSNLRIGCEGLGPDNVRLGLRPDGGVIDILGSVHYIDFLIVNGKMKSKAGEGEVDLSKVPFFSVKQNFVRGLQYEAVGTRIEYLGFNSDYGALVPSLGVYGEIVYQDVNGNPVILRSENDITFYMAEELNSWKEVHTTEYRNSKAGTLKDGSSKEKDDIPVYIFKWDAYSVGEEHKFEILTNTTFSALPQDGLTLSWSLNSNVSVSGELKDLFEEWFDVNISSPSLDESGRFYKYVVTLKTKKDFYRYSENPLYSDVPVPARKTYAPGIVTNSTWTSVLVKTALKAENREVGSFYAVISPSPYAATSDETETIILRNQDGEQIPGSEETFPVPPAPNITFQYDSGNLEYYITFIQFVGYTTVSWWTLLERSNEEEWTINNNTNPTGTSTPYGRYSGSDSSQIDTQTDDALHIVWNSGLVGLRSYEMILAYSEDESFAKHINEDLGFCTHWDVMANVMTSRWTVKKRFEDINIELSSDDFDMSSSSNVMIFNYIGTKTLKIQTNTKCKLKFSHVSSLNPPDSFFNIKNNRICFLDGDNNPTDEIVIESSDDEQEVSIRFLYNISAWKNEEWVSVVEHFASLDVYYYQGNDCLSYGDPYAIYWRYLHTDLSCTYIKRFAFLCTSRIFETYFEAVQFNNNTVSSGQCVFPENLSGLENFDNSAEIEINIFPCIESYCCSRNSNTYYRDFTQGEWSYISSEKNKVRFKYSNVKLKTGALGNFPQISKDNIKTQFPLDVDRELLIPLTYRCFLKIVAKEDVGGKLWYFNSNYAGGCVSTDISPLSENTGQAIYYYMLPKKSTFVVSTETGGIGISYDSLTEKYYIILGNAVKYDSMYYDNFGDYMSFVVSELKINNLSANGRLEVQSSPHGEYSNVDFYIKDIDNPPGSFVDSISFVLHSTFRGAINNGYYTEPRLFADLDYSDNISQDDLDDLVGAVNDTSEFNNYGTTDRVSATVNVDEETTPRIPTADGYVYFSPGYFSHKIKINYSSTTDFNFASNLGTVASTKIPLGLEPIIESWGSGMTSWDEVVEDSWNNATTGQQTLIVPSDQDSYITVRTYLGWANSQGHYNSGLGPFSGSTINDIYYNSLARTNKLLATFPIQSSQTDYMTTLYLNIDRDRNYISFLKVLEGPYSDTLASRSSVPIGIYAGYPQDIGNDKYSNTKTIDDVSWSTSSVRINIIRAGIGAINNPFDYSLYSNGAIQTSDYSSGDHGVYVVCPPGCSYSNWEGSLLLRFPINYNNSPSGYRFSIYSDLADVPGQEAPEDLKQRKAGTQLDIIVKQKAYESGYEFLSCGYLVHTSSGGDIERATELVIPTEISNWDSVSGVNITGVGTISKSYLTYNSSTHSLTIPEVKVPANISQQSKNIEIKLVYDNLSEESLAFIPQGYLNLVYYDPSVEYNVEAGEIIGGRPFPFLGTLSYEAPAEGTTNQRLIYPLGYTISDAMDKDNYNKFYSFKNPEDANNKKRTIEVDHVEWFVPGTKEIGVDTFFSSYKTEFVYNDTKYEIPSLENIYITKEEYISQNVRFDVYVSLNMRWPYSIQIDGAEKTPEERLMTEISYMKDNGNG